MKLELKDGLSEKLHALAAPERIHLVMFLAQTGSQGAYASQCAAALNTAPSKTSFHLAALLDAGLVSRQREGKYLRYRAELHKLEALISQVAQSCCNCSVTFTPLTPAP